MAYINDIAKRYKHGFELKGQTTRWISLIRISMLALLTSFSFPSTAGAVEGSPLPDVHIQAGGELVLTGDSVDYIPWHSQQLTGKVYVIQHIAGRSSAKALNAPLIERIKAAKLPKAHYQTITVVNTDDAIWGTGGMVKGKLESSKKEFPWSMMVLDKDGVARSAWNLDEGSSAIMVIDSENRVRWMKDGALNHQEQQAVMSLIQALLQP